MAYAALLRGVEGPRYAVEVELDEFVEASGLDSNGWSGPYPATLAFARRETPAVGENAVPGVVCLDKELDEGVAALRPVGVAALLWLGVVLLLLMIVRTRTPAPEVVLTRGEARATDGPPLVGVDESLLPVLASTRRFSLMSA